MATRRRYTIDDSGGDDVALSIVWTEETRALISVHFIDEDPEGDKTIELDESAISGLIRALKVVEADK